MINLKDKLEHIEKKEIMKALLESDFVMARAAKQLGITERMIGYKIKKYKLKTRKGIYERDEF